MAVEYRRIASTLREALEEVDAQRERASKSWIDESPVGSLAHEVDSIMRATLEAAAQLRARPSVVRPTWAVAEQEAAELADATLREAQRVEDMRTAATEERIRLDAALADVASTLGAAENQAAVIRAAEAQAAALRAGTEEEAATGSG